MRLEVAVCLPHESETVAVVRTVVTHALGSFGVRPDCVDDIGLALSEACANVVIHAADDDEYEVRVQIDERRCVVSVRNTGHGFDASALRDEMPDALSPSGRGVAIMRAVMDDVAFTSEPSTGTIVRLVKDLALVADGTLARLLRRRGDSPG